MSEPLDSRSAALDELPEAYAVAIRLREGGASAEVIAERLGIELVAVEPLLAVAAAKLQTILRRGERG